MAKGKGKQNKPKAAKAQAANVTDPADPAFLNNANPVDPADPAMGAVFSQLQGNILRGHGRDHALFIFLQFGADSATTRAALKAFAATFITSAAKQQHESQQFKAFGIPGGMFGSI